jgi:hypothetical protein
MIPPPFRLTKLVIASSVLVVWPFMEGCSHSSHMGFQGNAPALMQQDAPARARGGTNPNAPYLVVSSTPQLVKRPSTPYAGTLDTCNSQNLSVSEIAAAVDGKYRAVKIAFTNQSTAPCKLSGYPSIVLMDQNNSPVANVVVDRVTTTTLNAEVTQQPAQSAASQKNAEVALEPKGQAWFQLAWSTGDDCPVVSQVDVSAPGSTETFTVNHPLTVCDGRVRLSTLQSDPTTN